MPKLWSDTIAEHRRAVYDAILQAAWDLVAEHGLMTVTMSQIAERAGIGRATLYKYFPDVEAVLVAGHERHVADHLDQLAALRDSPGDAAARLESVLTTYAMIARYRSRHGTPELSALLHHGERGARARQPVTELFQDLVAEAGHAGRVRDDVPADELAEYCLHALDAAAELASETAVHRLVAVVLAGLRPNHADRSASGGREQAHERSSFVE